MSDAPKTKKEFLDIVRKERQVSYENHKKEPFSKSIKLAKKGTMELRRVLAKGYQTYRGGMDAPRFMG